MEETLMRASAMQYVEHLLGQGYTVARARAEVVYGLIENSVRGLGFQIRKGKILVPGHRPSYTFDFAELVSEILFRRRQLSLF